MKDDKSVVSLGDTVGAKSRSEISEKCSCGNTAPRVIKFKFIGIPKRKLWCLAPRDFGAETANPVSCEARNGILFRRSTKKQENTSKVQSALRHAGILRCGKSA